MFYSRGINRRKRWYRIFSIGRRKLVAVGLILAFFIIAIITVFVTYSCRALQYDLERVVRGSGESVLYDSANVPLMSLTGDAPLIVTWDDLPKNLVNAFVAREDETFFEHNGVVYSSVLRSLVRNVSSMSYEQGASTITMQLTRNVYELSEKSLDRKLLEALLAQRIERHYDKQTILTQYLNRIYFGQNCYGVAAAAHRYFGKRVSELNLVECATLAGLVRGPSLFNPVTNMEKAMVVKRETLERMQELGFITQEQYDEAEAAAIVLAPAADDSRSINSYAAMWAHHELDDMREELGENVGGISVVTNLSLPLQQRVEEAVERALVVVEKQNSFPEEWLPLLHANAQEAERLRSFFDEIVRPSSMKVRGQDNDLSHVLQCCVMVVDARRNNKGRVLAMVSGRSVVDGEDRWRGYCMPGRAMAPFLYSCACLPGGDDAHIVTQREDVTGARLGYDVVSSAYQRLDMGLELPSRENELQLYRGEFMMRRLDLARVLFDIQNDGRNYDFKLIDRVWSRGGTPLYSFQPVVEGEYIRREGARAVAQIAPFVIADREPIVLNEKLPNGHGNMCMVFNQRGVAVFVWMGFDDPADMPTDNRMSVLIRRVSYCLARELHEATRTMLRERTSSK